VGAGAGGRTGTDRLALLLARRGNAEAGEVLAPALTVAPEDSFVLIRSRSRRWGSAGLDDSLGDLTVEAHGALDVA
jgi:hypothetical protein